MTTADHKPEPRNLESGVNNPSQDHTSSLVLESVCDLVDTADASEWCASHHRPGGMCLRFQVDDITDDSKAMLIAVKQGADSPGAIRKRFAPAGPGRHEPASFWQAFGELEERGLIDVDRDTAPYCVTPTWKAYPQ